MTSFERFAAIGLAEAESRLARGLPPPVRDHPLAIEAVESSAIGRFVSRSMALLCRAAETSVAARFVRSLIEVWRNADWRARYRSSGLLLIVAVLVHVLLLWLQGLVVGWLWAIVPAIVAAIGVVLMLWGISSASAPPETPPGKAR